MAVVTPLGWPTKVWAAAEVLNFDPDDEVDLIRPFMAAVAERIKSVQQYNPLNTSGISAAASSLSFRRYNAQRRVEDGVNADPITGSDNVFLGTLNAKPLAFPGSEDQDRIHPLWSPVRRFFGGHLRLNPFWDGTTAQNSAPNPFWCECWAYPPTWPDRWFRNNKYSTLFTDAPPTDGFGPYSAGGSLARKQEMAVYAGHPSGVAKIFTPDPNGAGKSWWFHGYPAYAGEPTPAGSDTSVGRGRVLGVPAAQATGSFDPAYDADFLAGGSGWQYVQMAAWLLRKYFNWPTSPYRNFSSVGVGSAVGAGLPFTPSTVQPIGTASEPFPGAWGRLFGLTDSAGPSDHVEVPMRYWPCPFTRKHPRVIHRLDMPGTAGQVAEFRAYLLNANNLAAKLDRHPYDVTTPTPADQVGHSGKLFVHDGTTWVANTNPAIIAADIVTTKGLIRGGDLFGEWILNDLHDFINLLVCTVGWVTPTRIFLRHTASSSMTALGDPYDTRPSFFLSWLPPAITSGGQCFFPTRSESLTSAAPRVGANESPYRLTGGDVSKSIASMNFYAPAQQVYEPGASPTAYTTRWDGLLKVRGFNPQAVGMTRRIEIEHRLDVSLAGQGTGVPGAVASKTVKAIKTTSATTVDVDQSSLNTLFDTLSASAGDPLAYRKSFRVRSAHEVKCWWDVPGGYAYTSGTRAAAPDSVTIT